MRNETDPRLARRFLTGVLLLVQLVLVGAVPLADVLADSAGPAGPHVEALGGDAPCPPGHDHQKCQFCRHDGTFRARLSSESLSITVPAQRRAYANAIDAFVPASQAVSPHRSRAPPSV